MNRVPVDGSDRPEVVKVRVGFLPLSDCASVVMASLLGFDRKYGIRIIPVRESSWAAVRDKLVAGSLDMAHALYGLVYGVHMGISGPQRNMAVLMTINRNGQGLTLSRKLVYQGVTTLESLAARIASDHRRYTFAQTFPTGTHAMWPLCDAATALGVDLPGSPLRSSRLLDGDEWNGLNPAAYADHFTVRAPQPSFQAC